ncbi:MULTISPECIES: dihydrofolate reductase family protein [unclassified Mesorhizobium]|uniref:dihydrofolate reductase family protein n=1 Tax=unclassified Mesorhizobium TaxID=325217 RepID=UPI000FCAFAE7|nr:MULTISPECIES: dihydrofolate reductase family protein [unclassified Mesorhizobium]RUU89791.1 dihydrofolate reductase [Mesorhizobium sp. M7A.F.Ca.MR.176.00.0.0]RVD48134.1 dihydrofolate reductase [Mesorhizobium sp. M7A.F.Ca.ET.027.03.2.1]
MRKIISATFVSLDGVMQAPGGPQEDPVGGFKFGGWTFHYFDEAGSAAMDELFSKPFALLLGRRTYDIFAAYWPYQKDSIADAFNPATKYVATHRPDTLTWQNTQSLGPDIVAELRRLKQEDGPDLLIQGSGDLIQTLLANGLIDEIRLMIFPLLLGKGKRLFGDSAMPAAFKLIKSQATSTGVIMATYERSGEIKVGSFVTGEPSEAELERRKNWK